MFFKRNNKQYAMESEILEQADVLKGLVDRYNTENIDLPDYVEKIVLVASGSSYHCARFSADLLGEIADIDARAIYSSEFNLKKVIPHDKNTLYIFITQSGETSDTLCALKRVNNGFTDENGEKYYLNTLSITNKPNSSIWNISKYKVDCAAGVEKSVAATKSFSAQMLCVLIVALKIAQRKGQNIDEYLKSLNKLPGVIRQTYTLRPRIIQLARLLSKQHCVVITADGISYSIAKEGVLKIKETSYMNINAAILGEFMHGHLAVLNNKSALLYMSVDGISQTAVSNLEKIRKDYNPATFIIGKHNNKFVSNFNINIDCENEILQMFSNVIIVQLLAFEIAKKLGRNIDKPKGLKKVVIQ